MQGNGQTKRHIEKLKTPNQIELFFSGPKLDAGKKPLFLYFALSGETSLSEAPFNQPVLFLNEHFPNIRTASLNLPFHSKEYPLEEAMSLWKAAIQNEPFFLLQFIDTISSALTTLIEEGLVETKALGFGGLSRGAYIATLLAAKRKECKALLNFAPMTEISFLSEMGDIQEETKLKKFSSKLTHTAIRTYIGNRDLRVGTRNCFEWMETVVDEQYKAGIRSPKVELFINPSIGHKGHGTSEPIFNEGAKWMGKELNS